MKTFFPNVYKMNFLNLQNKLRYKTVLIPELWKTHFGITVYERSVWCHWHSLTYRYFCLVGFEIIGMLDFRSIICLELFYYVQFCLENICQEICLEICQEICLEICLEICIEICIKICLKICVEIWVGTCVESCL